MTRQTTPDGDSTILAGIRRPQASTSSFRHRDKEKNPCAAASCPPPAVKEAQRAAGDNKEAERFTVGCIISHSRKKCYTPASTGVRNNPLLELAASEGNYLQQARKPACCITGTWHLLGARRGNALKGSSSGGRFRADFLIAPWRTLPAETRHGEHQESRPTTAGPGNRRGSPSTRPADRSTDESAAA